jgi:hypothetical protein
VWVQAAKRREEREWRRELPDEIYDQQLWDYFYDDYPGYWLRNTPLEADIWLYRAYQQERWLQEIGACSGDFAYLGTKIGGNLLMWSKG